jgi:biopolymer transport protein ExbB
MKLVEWVYRVLISTGSGWVMWALIFLSVLSVAIILERAWFFLSLRDDIGQLARDLQRALESGIEAAKKRMSASPSAEAAVVMAGLEMADRGPEAAEEAMNGAAAIQRIKLEKRLAFLGTLGNNAPFIGLFGTVIGVMIAFGKLSPDATTGQSAGVNKDVMQGISEALVATAVGIFVAIPAVAFNNLFQRMTKATLANTDALSKTLLGFLKTNTSYRLPDLRDNHRDASEKKAPEKRAPEKSFAKDDDDEEEERPAPKKEKAKESPKKKPPVEESAAEEDA